MFPHSASLCGFEFVYSYDNIHESVYGYGSMGFEFVYDYGGMGFEFVYGYGGMGSEFVYDYGGMGFEFVCGFTLKGTNNYYGP